MKKIDSYLKLNRKEFFRSIMAFAINTVVLLATIFVILALKVKSLSVALNYLKINVKLTTFVAFSVITLVIIAFLFF